MKLSGWISASTMDKATLRNLKHGLRTTTRWSGQPFQLDSELQDLVLEFQPMSRAFRRRDHAVGDLGRVDPEVVDQPHVLAPACVRDRGQEMHVQFGEQVR